ncbi:hypothetical protein TcBrA4_0139530 [Trypanosoma cruzi]|nr:hypothetical protein TcBrA4_0139530 [Trypanosoma cruzi]
MRLYEHNIHIRSKTKDNVFVNIRLTVHVQVIPGRETSAFYSVEAPLKVIQSYVENCVETKIPLYNLDALFIERGTISQQLKSETDAVIEGYGWDIVSALITEIDPGAAMTEAINSIQKNHGYAWPLWMRRRQRKCGRIRAAEAACESRRLAGRGLAEQRKAIVGGSAEICHGDAARRARAEQRGGAQSAHDQPILRHHEECNGEQQRQPPLHGGSDWTAVILADLRNGVAQVMR